MATTVAGAAHPRVGDWRLLLLLHHDAHWDAANPDGADSFYAVVIRAADLAEGRYDRLAVDVVCDEP